MRVRHSSASGREKASKAVLAGGGELRSGETPTAGVCGEGDGPFSTGTSTLRPLCMNAIRTSMVSDHDGRRRPKKRRRRTTNTNERDSLKKNWVELARNAVVSGQSSDGAP